MNASVCGYRLSMAFVCSDLLVSVVLFLWRLL